MRATQFIGAAALIAVVSAETYSSNQATDGLTLLANARQTASQRDGSVNGTLKAGQSPSKKSKNNFINICSGKTLTNGTQIPEGSCNGIPMGDIPAKTQMISSIIIFPETNAIPIEPDTDFNITVQVANLVAGSFTNPDGTYYAAPQALKGGKVVGHVHVTVQDLGGTLNPKQVLDPTKFVFFKGINDVGDGNGLLKAIVTGGLPAGYYRVCTMVSASNHQPVLMPVAQRGAADDCTKFIVAAGGNTTSNACVI
ncbi:ribosomal protein s17 [Diplocarpon rosae]|nr:ribosomal protein s17 [Diplocarpon rosae]